jgi:UDP-N-acetylmuramoylalanine--D-glutamate ligase
VTMDLIANSDTPVVVGLGSTGLSCARYYQRCGIEFAVVDSRQQPPGIEALRAECSQAEVILGELPRERVLNAGRLVVSPGVPLDQPLIAEAIERGIPVCGDIDLFVAEARAPVVGITGSNAKSTVTELLGRMAQRAGIRVAVGGNLGTPALDLLDDDVELYVLELSSFQLERAGSLGLELATILNLSDDHLDRHGNLDNYQRAKQRIFTDCSKLVINRDDPRSAPPRELPVPCWSFGLGPAGEGEFGVAPLQGEDWLCHASAKLMPVRELAMVGGHNTLNALASLAMGSALELPLDAMIAELKIFSGLPHRCQLVGEHQRVRYINDSKATNPGATAAALQGLALDRNIILLAGGEGKNADFSVLREDVAASCKAVVLFGADAAQLEHALTGVAPVYRATSLQAAVSTAAELADSGDVVLLSPACASFDMFSGFAERGEMFALAVRQQMNPGDAL